MWLLFTGISWRVGVVTPPDPKVDLQAIGEIGRVMVEASQKVRNFLGADLLVEGLAWP
jgi:hypothetical protein